MRASANGAALLEPSVLDGLAGRGRERDSALARLHLFLVAVGWFELERREGQPALGPADAARLVHDAADAACESILGRLGDYHGQSRFPVWAAKFAIHETAAAARRSASRKTEGSRVDPAAPLPAAGGGE